MKSCHVCGRLVSPAAVSCPGCGQPFRETSGDQLAGCGCLALAAVGSVLALGMMKSGHTGWFLVGLAVMVGLAWMNNRQQGG